MGFFFLVFWGAEGKKAEGYTEKWKLHSEQVPKT